MPYKDLEKQRKAQRESARRRRGSKLALPPCEPVPARSWPADPGDAFEEWTNDLTTPPGHPLAGRPMVAPAFLVNFVRAVMRPGIKEGVLCTARKNSKTGGIAMLALAHLAEGAPFTKPGQRIAVVSLDRGKAAETKKSVEDIAVTSGLKGLRFLRSPAPGGKIETSDGSELTILAGIEAGTSGGFDLVLIDEAGKMTEKHRGLIETCLGALAARGGRAVYLSIYGNGLFTQPLVDRADDDAVVIHLHQPDPGARIDDETQWHRGNPGLGTIKNIEHMRAMCRKAQADRSYKRTFLAEEMNLPVDASRDPIVTVDEWDAIQGLEAEATGPAYLGLDIGGSVSACAASVYFPATGLLMVTGGWPKEPDLHSRGLADGVGGRYEEMRQRGELVLVGDRWADAGAFIKHVMEWVGDEVDIREVLADQYRRKEIEQAILDAECNWTMTWRRMGLGPDGTTDVKAFQREVIEGKLRPRQSLALRSSISEAVVIDDKNNNCALERGRRRGRIDWLSASILAVGAGSRRQVAGGSWAFHEAEFDDIETGEYQNQNEGVLVL